MNYEQINKSPGGSQIECIIEGVPCTMRLVTTNSIYVTITQGEYEKWRDISNHDVIASNILFNGGTVDLFNYDAEQLLQFIFSADNGGIINHIFINGQLYRDMLIMMAYCSLCITSSISYDITKNKVMSIIQQNSIPDGEATLDDLWRH